MHLMLIGQCQTKHIERNLSFDGFWTCSVLPDHWRLVQVSIDSNTNNKYCTVLQEFLVHWWKEKCSAGGHSFSTYAPGGG